VANASPTANPTVAAATTASAPNLVLIAMPRMTPPSGVPPRSPVAAGAAEPNGALERLELEIGGARSEREVEAPRVVRARDRDREPRLELARAPHAALPRSEEHTSELQSLAYLVCRLLLEKKKKNTTRDKSR